MKVLLTWSSKTGNTRAVGEAMAEVCPAGTMVCPIEEAPAGGGDYDLVILGYWVDKGMPNKRCRDFIKAITKKKIAFFGTLGAYPDSDHGRDCMARAEELVKDNDIEVCGHFICQGKVDPALLEMMAKMPNNPHAMTEERKARIEEAKKHPNEDDFNNARSWLRQIFSELEGQE